MMANRREVTVDDESVITVKVLNSRVMNGKSQRSNVGRWSANAVEAMFDAAERALTEEAAS
jgi:hypothetical protein